MDGERWSVGSKLLFRRAQNQLTRAFLSSRGKSVPLSSVNGREFSLSKDGTRTLVLKGTSLALNKTWAPSWRRAPVAPGGRVVVTHRAFSSIYAYRKWQSLCELSSKNMDVISLFLSRAIPLFKNNENNICKTMKVAKHWSFPETARWLSLISHTCSWTSMSLIFITMI